LVSLSWSANQQMPSRFNDINPDDIESLEVLKGASALYYGFSSPAGIVNLTMKRPTPDLLLSEDTFAVSNGGIGEHVDVGDTVGKFGYRVNAVYAHMDTGITYSTGRRYLLGLAFDYGFNSPTHFGRVFRARFGMTPREYRRDPPPNAALNP